MPLGIRSLALVASIAMIAAAAAAGEVDTASLPELGGVKLHAEISGHGAPIVFLHGGLSFFDSSFVEQKAYFSAFRTVIGIDQRGHGHSPDNDQPFSYRQMADDTATLIGKLNLGPVDVVGFSDGGNVGLLLARYHPQLVRRLVVSGANVSGDFNGIVAYARFLLRSNEDFAATLPAGLRQEYARVSPDGERHWLAVVAKTKELWSTWNILTATDLSAIRIPVLVMAGDHDVIPLDHTMKIFRSLPQAELCILPGAGHKTMQDRPEDFNRLTREFLERVP
jgi:pimeloyl-ACP methyl ester carboxylesterase